MMRNLLFLAAGIGLPLCFTGCSGEEDMNAKMAEAAIQAKQGDWKNAGENAAVVAEAKPDEVAPKLLQVLAYEKAGSDDKALDLARQCVEIAPEDFTARYTLGRLAAKNPMRRSEAFAILERALELKSEDRNTLVLLCNLGTELNHPRVIKYLHQLRQTKEFAASPVLYYHFGCYFIQTKNYVQAEKWLHSAVKMGIRSKDWNVVLNSTRRLDQTGYFPQKVRNWYVLYRNVSGNRGAEHKEVCARIKELDRRNTGRRR